MQKEGAILIEAVLFDLDGVIVSTDDLHYKAWLSIAQKEGIYFDETINNKLRGVSRMESLSIILENAHKTYTQEEKELLAKEKNNLYVSSLQSLSEQDILPGVKDLIRKLKQQDYLIAIASSSKNAKRILDKIGLLHTFDAISDGTNITKSKPDPEVFIKAAQMLQITPEKCAVVEDAISGLIAAKRANMITFATGDARGSKYADYDFTELPTVLKLSN